MGLLSNQIGRVRRRRPRSDVPSARVPAPTRLENNLIKRVVDAQDSIPERSRVSGEYTHLSSLLNVCPRAQVIARAMGTEALQSVTGAHRVMWKIGRATEKHIRDSYINAVDFEGVYGRWVCTCGRTHYTGLFNRGAPRCNFCDYQPSLYDELTMVDEEAKITGNPDLVLVIDGRVVVVELKSMNKEDFDKLEAPVPDHIMQAGGYRRLYHVNGHAVADEVIILYCKKDFKWQSPYKEFHVNVAPNGPHRHVETSLDLMWEAGRGIAQGSMQSLPERLCSTPGETRARNCHSLATCWNV